MGTGVGDVASHGAADHRGDGHEINMGREEGLVKRLSDRRAGFEGRVEDKRHLDEGGDKNDAIHGKTGAAGHEDSDRGQRTDGAADLRVEIDHRIQAQARATYIADVEEQATDDDDNGEKVPGSGYGGIRVTATIRQILAWTMKSMTIETRIAKAKAAPSFTVKVAV